MLTIFSPWEQRVVARCQGHSSFVSAVAFDDLRCDGRTYRFGSVGEDNKLILVSLSSYTCRFSSLKCIIQVGFFQRGSSSSKNAGWCFVSAFYHFLAAIPSLHIIEHRCLLQYLSDVTAQRCIYPLLHLDWMLVPFHAIIRLPPGMKLLWYSQSWYVP